MHEPAATWPTNATLLMRNTLDLAVLAVALAVYVIATQSYLLDHVAECRSPQAIGRTTSPGGQLVLSCESPREVGRTALGGTTLLDIRLGILAGAADSTLD